MPQLKTAIRILLSKFGLALVPLEVYERNKSNPDFLRLSRWVSGDESINHVHLKDFIMENFSKSNSQLQQDLVAAFLLKNCLDTWKPSRFFIEFGATNGISLSNTNFLEKNQGWSGILAEPAKWHADLVANRKCTIDFRCVYSESGEQIQFSEVDLPELSTITRLAKSDVHKKSRNRAIYYEVETVSLNDLLESHKAPKLIDYLSIDTEGSEIEILSSFDFTKWDIGFITVEVTSESKQYELDSILVPQGYTRILMNYSEWEAWYVNEKFYASLPGF
jgi:FkbM family methyltransferase